MHPVGNDIHFSEGRYQPDDPFGLHLLAHEVGHTVQQSCGAVARQHKLEVSTPADALEVKAVLRAAFQTDTPVYIRIGKKGEPDIHSAIPEFSWGKWNVMQEGDKLCILSMGNMLPTALEVAKALGGVKVVDCTSVKPLDEKMLADVFAKYKNVVTLEEHSLIGGFSSAVAEWLVDNMKELTGSKNSNSYMMLFPKQKLLIF